MQTRSFYVSADTNRGPIAVTLQALNEADACRSFRAAMPNAIDIFDLFATRAEYVPHMRTRSRELNHAIP